MEAEQILYGIHSVEELLKNRMSSIDHIYFSNETRNPALFNLIKICRKERLSYNLLPDIKLEQLSHTKKHQGVIAFCSIKSYITIEELKEVTLQKKDALIILPASVEDPGNLGTMIRSSVAFNVDAMILERKNTSPVNASVSKSSAGMVEYLPIARPKNIESLLTEYKEAGFTIIGADAAKGEAPEKISMTGPTILILGGEHRGIPPYLAKSCTSFVSIPMSEKAQSLNVSASAAVLLYECNRQRRNMD
jgi:23S rRNA (guanosine2251-2'-O)-methyltransferase